MKRFGARSRVEAHVHAQEDLPRWPLAKLHALDHWKPRSGADVGKPGRAQMIVFKSYIENVYCFHDLRAENMKRVFPLVQLNLLYALKESEFEEKLQFERAE